jgi:hypothetical protein
VVAAAVGRPDPADRQMATEEAAAQMASLLVLAAPAVGSRAAAHQWR